MSLRSLIRIKRSSQYLEIIFRSGESSINILKKYKEKLINAISKFEEHF
jgi:hypothetical protein